MKAFVLRVLLLVLIVGLESQSRAGEEKYINILSSHSYLLDYLKTANGFADKKPEDTHMRFFRMEGNLIPALGRLVLKENTLALVSQTISIKDQELADFDRVDGLLEEPIGRIKTNIMDIKFSNPNAHIAIVIFFSMKLSKKPQGLEKTLEKLCSLLPRENGMKFVCLGDLSPLDDDFNSEAIGYEALKALVSDFAQENAHAQDTSDFGEKIQGKKYEYGTISRILDQTNHCFFDSNPRQGKYRFTVEQLRDYWRQSEFLKAKGLNPEDVVAILEHFGYLYALPDHRYFFSLNVFGWQEIERERDSSSYFVRLIGSNGTSISMAIFLGAVGPLFSSLKIPRENISFAKVTLDNQRNSLHFVRFKLGPYNAEIMLSAWSTFVELRLIGPLPAEAETGLEVLKELAKILQKKLPEMREEIRGGTKRKLNS